MLISSDELLKERCKRLIEEKLEWGSSENWTNQDFDLLSDKIFEGTGITLSQTTLKRIWGKVKYDSAPTVTTLNTLARFLDFENWRDFRQKQTLRTDIIAVDDQMPVTEVSATKEKSRRSILFPVLATGLSLLSLLSWNFFSAKSITNRKTPPGSFQFNSRKMILKGVPNSVVFDYDATSSPEDSIYIQQSWDNRLRARVPKEQHLHTAIYYYPGFFQARLLAGDKIIKEHDLFIQTDGWLPLIEQDPVPVYFKKEDAIDSGRLTLSLKKIKDHIFSQPSLPYVYYANVRDFGDLKSDDFILETAVRNDFKEGSGVCQKSEIRLLTEGSMVSIPLSAKGCISDNNLFCLGHYIKGNENDLSGFGVDFSHFVKVRLEVRNGKAMFFVNDKMVYVVDGIARGTKLKGIVFRFQGSGSVDWIKLSKADGTRVYDEEF